MLACCVHLSCVAGYPVLMGTIVDMVNIQVTVIILIITSIICITAMFSLMTIILHNMEEIYVLRNRFGYDKYKSGYL